MTSLTISSGKVAGVMRTKSRMSPLSPITTATRISIYPVRNGSAIPKAMLSVVSLMVCQISWAEPDHHIPFPEATVHKPVTHPKHSNLLLVARNRWEQGVGGVMGMNWCGNRHLVFSYGGASSAPESGGFFLDIDQKSTFQFRPFGKAISVSCSSDGQWLHIYKESVDKKAYNRYRYDLRSGREEAVMRLYSRTEAGRGVWSFDGMKLIYFDRQLGQSLMTNEPRWKIYWLNAPVTQELVWLSDSVSFLVLNNHPIGDGKTVTHLDLKHVLEKSSSSSIVHVARLRLNIDHIRALKIDSSNRVYGLRYQYLPYQIGKRQEVNISLVRCEIKNRSQLNCKPAIDGNPSVLPSYAISRSGNEIFYITKSETKANQCLVRYMVTRSAKENIWCGYVTELALSPDSKHIAFTANNLFNPDIHGQSDGLAIYEVQR